jgi:hypothetical protein
LIGYKQAGVQEDVLKRVHTRKVCNPGGLRRFFAFRLYLGGEYYGRQASHLYHSLTLLAKAPKAAQKLRLPRSSSSACCHARSLSSGRRRVLYQTKVTGPCGLQAGGCGVFSPERTVNERDIVELPLNGATLGCQGSKRMRAFRSSNLSGFTPGNARSSAMLLKRRRCRRSMMACATSSLTPRTPANSSEAEVLTFTSVRFSRKNLVTFKQD